MSSGYLHLGLVGWPVAHSLSPALHQAALGALGLAGEYRLYPVSDQPAAECAALAGLVARLRDGALQGLNVTLPYKTAILPLLDELTGQARAIGAANTLFVENGRVIGDNTDAQGFLTDLTRQFPGLECPPRPGAEALRALVLGAGGAARAVAWALLGAGWQVVVAARRPEQGAQLCSALGDGAEPRRLSATALDERSIAALLARRPVDLVVNATPAGTPGDPSPSPWPAGIELPAGAVVYDLVYRPQETPLLGRARAAGLPAAGGGGMLVEQAALSFERWTGQPAPPQAMRLALERSLAAP